MKFIVRLVKAAISLFGVVVLVLLCLAADWLGHYGPEWMRTEDGNYINAGTLVAIIVLFLTTAVWCLCAIDWVTQLHKAWTVQRIKAGKYNEHMDQ